MPVAGLHDLLIKELHDIYSAEKQIIAALPKMIDLAIDEKLKTGLTTHLEQTRMQVERLDAIHAELGISHDTRIVCEGMRGIIAENEISLQEIQDSHTKDAAIIAGAQKVEHYEIAVYGSLSTWAHEIGNDTIADLFEATLTEEKQADTLLTKVAQGGLLMTGVNEKAADSIETG
jgi:ferritin-like metal-binding protein YciE